MLKSQLFFLWVTLVFLFLVPSQVVGLSTPDDDGQDESLTLSLNHSSLVRGDDVMEIDNNSAPMNNVNKEISSKDRNKTFSQLTLWKDLCTKSGIFCQRGEDASSYALSFKKALLKREPLAQLIWANFLAEKFISDTRKFIQTKEILHTNAISYYRNLLENSVPEPIRDEAYYKLLCIKAQSNSEILKDFIDDERACSALLDFQKRSDLPESKKSLAKFLRAFMKAYNRQVKLDNEEAAEILIECSKDSFLDASEKARAKYLLATMKIEGRTKKISDEEAHNILIECSESLFLSEFERSRAKFFKSFIEIYYFNQWNFYEDVDTTLAKCSKDFQDVPELIWKSNLLRARIKVIHNAGGLTDKETNQILKEAKDNVNLKMEFRNEAQILLAGMRVMERTDEIDDETARKMLISAKKSFSFKSTESYARYTLAYLDLLNPTSNYHEIYNTYHQLKSDPFLPLPLRKDVKHNMQEMIKYGYIEDPESMQEPSQKKPKKS